MEEENIKDFDTWIQDKKPDFLFDYWRESMTQLRQLHGDVWNGVRFFLTLNGILAAITFGLWKGTGELTFTFILAFVGLITTLIGIRILGKHRNYYTDMLWYKSFLDKKMGFYDVEIHGQDLSLPWKIPKKYLDSALKDKAKWASEQKWRLNTISILLFLSYWIFLLGYIATMLFISIISWCDCN